MGNMINKYFAVLILSTLCCASAFSSDPNQLSGKDWMEMTRESKLTFVMIAIQSLRKSNVELSLPHMEYAELMDQYLTIHPQIISSELTNIFANMVYAVDPASRKQLNELNLSAKNRISQPYSRERTLKSYYDELGIPYNGDD